MKDAGRVADVLLGERSVEAVFGAELRDLRIGRVIAERGGHRIRGDDVRDRERDDRNTDHHGRDPDDAPQEKAEKAHGALAPYLLIAAKSVQSIGLQTNPFTFERRPNGSVGW